MVSDGQVGRLSLRRLSWMFGGSDVQYITTFSLSECVCLGKKKAPVLFVVVDVVVVVVELFPLTLYRLSFPNTSFIIFQVVLMVSSGEPLELCAKHICLHLLVRRWQLGCKSPCFVSDFISTMESRCHD